MPDNLHHDFAGAVLMAPSDPEHIEVAVKALLPRHPSPFQVIYHSHDVDVPIPLIFEFDSATRLRIPGGEIFANLRGEAYAKTFNLKVEVRKYENQFEPVAGGQKETMVRTPIVDWPESDGEAGRAMWNVGWQAAKDAGLELPDISLRYKLIAAMFDAVFEADIIQILAVAARV